MSFAVTHLIGFGARRASSDVADGIGRIPTMTGATTNGVTMSASSVLGAGNEAWRAGDKSYGAFWLSALYVNGTLNIDLGSAMTVRSYDAMNVGTYQNGLTRGWTLHGANASDYSDEVTLDTRSGIAWGSTGTAADTQTFTITSPGAYRYYRIKTTAHGGSYSGFIEVQLYT